MAAKEPATLLDPAWNVYRRVRTALLRSPAPPLHVVPICSAHIRVTQMTQDGDALAAFPPPPLLLLLLLNRPPSHRFPPFPRCLQFPLLHLLRLPLPSPHLPRRHLLHHHRRPPILPPLPVFPAGTSVNSVPNAVLKYVLRVHHTGVSAQVPPLPPALRGLKDHKPHKVLMPPFPAACRRFLCGMRR